MYALEQTFLLIIKTKALRITHFISFHFFDCCLLSSVAPVRQPPSCVHEALVARRCACISSGRTSFSESIESVSKECSLLSMCSLPKTSSNRAKLRKNLALVYSFLVPCVATDCHTGRNSSAPWSFRRAPQLRQRWRSHGICCVLSRVRRSF